MPHPDPTQFPHILLVGNYRPDGQRSMQRFTRLLADGLSGRGLSVEIFYPPVIFGRLGAANHGIGKWLGYFDKYILTPFFLRRAVRRTPRPRLIHICDHSNAIYTRVVAAEPHLVTCHDLLAIRSALGEIPQNPLRATGKRQQAMILDGLRRSRHIVSVSGATKEDVIRLVGDSPPLAHVIANALDGQFIRAAQTPRPALRQSLPDPLGLPPEAEIYTHIGGEKWYKNRAAVLRLFAAIARRRPEAQLAIIGCRFSGDQLEQNRCSGLTERIHYLHGITDEALRGLYARATLLLFPSWIEGFGWPILEAQACGCPVATLDHAPMNELNATPSLHLATDCEQSDWADQAASQIEESIHDVDAAPKPAALQAFSARFTNQSAIDAYLALYRSILTEGPAG